ncbi:MAG: hypothetical protein OEZ01_02715 [Candidatus Heimdallarchaeota archaeon]|nr:hypothetical protein [Candidatus Heimdallarchaeota archaeon]MDH5644889.1 hypothetical protein [Candidatus Heimdallarchaeota archaeon]
MQISTPNLQLILDDYNEIDNEYDIESRLKRYESTNKDLIEFAQKNGLEDVLDAARALFISDYIVTSSEVPSGFTDEDRRKSIINSFVEGLKRTDSTDKLMRIFYLSQKTGTHIRRNDAYLAGRGAERGTSLLMIKDFLLAPYLEKCQEILGEGSSHWELAILSSALLREFPDKELKKYHNIPQNYDLEKMVPVLWEFLNEYAQKNVVERNDNVVIPNIGDSQIFYVNNLGKLPLISTFRCDRRFVSNKEIDVLKPLIELLASGDESRKLLYMRGRIHKGDKNIILIRNPFIEGKPLIMFKTVADEINVTETISLLHQRGMERTGWTLIDNFSKSITKSTFENHEVEEEVEQEVEVEEVETKDIPVMKSSGGFFGKIKSLFGGGKTSTSTDGSTKAKSKTKVKQTVKQKVVKKREKKEVISTELPTFICEAIGINALGDLGLFEIFDTIRESDYEIIGAMESDFQANKTSFLTNHNFIDYKEINTLLDGLDKVIEAAANNYFSDDHQIIPTEVLFVTSEEDRFIICMDGNEDRLVGTIGKTKIISSSIVDRRTQIKTESFQRRTLHMRTGQLLNTRAHTPFDTATERIYKENIRDSTLNIIDGAMLNLTD